MTSQLVSPQNGGLVPGVWRIFACVLSCVLFVWHLEPESKHGIINMVHAFRLSSYGAPTPCPFQDIQPGWNLKPVTVIEEGRDVRGLSQWVQLYPGAQVNFFLCRMEFLIVADFRKWGICSALCRHLVKHTLSNSSSLQMKMIEKDGFQQVWWMNYESTCTVKLEEWVLVSL